MSVRVVLMLGLLLLLGACANTNPLQVTVSRCPAVAVVGDAGTLTRFRGEDRNVENVAFTASILNVKLDCVEGDDVRSQVSFEVGAQAGEAFSGGSVTLPYFVAVMKDNNQIVSKKIYDVTLNFGSDGHAVASQIVAQHIPTIDQARRYNYEVLLGFQLSVNEAVFNMER
ncbi:MAG: hypothetical protein HWE25_01345 [Alphaproteobacteria bacterium]|nr:hypothetical protein [Alphaproteobacteria bacterium]